VAPIWVCLGSGRLFRSRIRQSAGGRRVQVPLRAVAPRVAAHDGKVLRAQGERGRGVGAEGVLGQVPGPASRRHRSEKLAIGSVNAAARARAQGRSSGKGDK
jgi:hypothetical protein